VYVVIPSSNLSLVECCSNVPPFINKKERKSTQQQQIRFRLHKHTLSRFFFFFSLSLFPYEVSLLPSSKTQPESSRRRSTRSHKEIHHHEPKESSRDFLFPHRNKQILHRNSPLSVSGSLPAATRTLKRGKKNEIHNKGERKERNARTMNKPFSSSSSSSSSL